MRGSDIFSGGGGEGSDGYLSLLGNVRGIFLEM